MCSLDEECAVLVAAIEAAGSGWDDDTDPVEATLAWGAAIAMGAGSLREVATVEDREAHGVPVRVYRPDAPAPLPLVLFFHGGGFVIGSVDSHDPIVRRLADRLPAVVVSVDYRRGPQHRFPAAHDDAWSAFVWAVEHAAALGGDPERVALVGDSAGANLAIEVALRSRGEGGPVPVAQVLWLPLVDHRFDDQPSYEEFASGYVLGAEALAWFRANAMTDADVDDPRASPARAEDLSGLPPTFVATAACDPLRDQGEAFAARLAEAGVEVTLRRYDGAYHPFYGMTEMLTVARRLEDDTVAVLGERIIAGTGS